MMVSGVHVMKDIAQVGELAVNRTESIVSIVHMIFYETIHLMQSAYFLTVGAIETCIGLFTQETTLSDVSKKVRSALHSFFQWIKSLPERLLSYNIIHGGLMLGTGVCELLLGLQKFDCVTLGAATPVVMGLSNACFFFANLVMLVRNVQLFQKACQIPEEASDEVKDNAKRVKLSAIFSMISALNYIVGIATMFFGGPVALIVMFIALGLTFGGLKILYDWFCPYQEKLLK